ncbi:chemotaxis protein CheW [Xanthocytophaga agilis]|uniref:Chemotaxis protein CheW n=1 Tax=Xanthocytophaga agilis TaxID=3048010 RepID=A0AAE3RDG5_9BACT|nr:chemotaxis protein CheW [Xanthocytophaga agilis]MDJ1506634.1 chemotaxis protein CheW [Xanthocytophaga agilis]
MKTEFTSSSSYLSFKLGEEMFAINVLRVNKIVQIGKVTYTPHTPACIRGIIHLDGATLPVIDLHVKLAIPVMGKPAIHEPAIKKSDFDSLENNCLIVVTVHYLEANSKIKQNYTIGVLVDSVVEVFDLSEDQIKPLPDLGIDLNATPIKETCQVGKELILLLDTDKVFSPTQLITVSDLDSLLSHL